ncbi:protein NO VEIN domain-containing protein [Agromyces sp. Marseille-P2726]|uniref:protein NO VEIN domain-containing protein n=1 Tax=Agromyces sp. Marseille-P2726 TaxID=2709132 RepID=UPI00156D73EE|nr:DUF3883 domain-containing protein [Agromyces sp. Marseille-P2726]
MVLNNWWANDPAEIYWMEIRSEPEGLGEYLLAPQRDGGGNENWSYSLTSYVQPGDRILHWHKPERGEPAIIGWSEAVGPLETLTWSWQARGTRGRARGVPTVGPAWRMPLANYTELERPVTRTTLNAQRSEILALLDDITASAGKPIYAPFQNYGDRELRAQQGYLTKFPAALVALLFDHPADTPAIADDRVRTARASGAQGYMADAAKRVALERHAVSIAIAHYRGAGATEIEERGKPYDLRVVIDGVVRHVEVKGSIGVGVQSVQLTQGEVEHARAYQPTDLFVVDGIIAENSGDTVTVSGGNARIWPDWLPDDGDLRPTHLRYSLP